MHFKQAACMKRASMWAIHLVGQIAGWLFKCVGRGESRASQWVWCFKSGMTLEVLRDERLRQGA